MDHGSRGGWGHYVLWRRVCTICREGRGGGHFKLHFTRLCTLLDSLFKTIAEFESQEAALDFSRGRGPGVGRRGGLRRGVREEGEEGGEGEEGNHNVQCNMQYNKRKLGVKCFLETNRERFD